MSETTASRATLQDRHQNNWAVLRHDNNIRICPMYDSGSSLCCYLEEESIDSFLGKDKVRFESMVNSKSKSRIRVNKKIKKEPTHLEVLQYIKQHYNECIEDLINVINKSITERAIDEILSNYSEDLLSRKRKKLIKMFLLEKVRMINATFQREEG